MKRSTTGWLVVLATLCLPCPAVEMEPDGPGYLTDIHGAAGVLRALVETRSDFPQYHDYTRGTLQWLYDVRIEKDGAYQWMMSTSAPEGHPSHRLHPGVPLFTVDIITELQDWQSVPLYKDLYDGCMKTMTQSMNRSTAGGRNPWKMQRPMGLGHSHGPGTWLSHLSGLYAKTNDEWFKQAAFNYATLLKTNAKEWNENGTYMVNWFLKPSEQTAWRGTDWRTGWCDGTAGMVGGLLDFHKTFPNHTFEDGSSALDLSCGGLNWILTKKVVEGNGWTFMNIRTDGLSHQQPGFGSGIGGIGFAFLEGYKNCRDTQPQLAERYLEAARKAAVFCLEMIEKGWTYRGSKHRNHDGSFSYLNLGVCGGVGGTGRFLIPMAQAVQESDPEIAKRCLDATRVVAKWFEEDAIPCGDGIAWPARPKFGGAHTINIALDYGLSGQVLALHIMAKGLDDTALMGLTHEALKGLISLAVKEGHGYKWPLFTKVADIKK